MASSHFPDPLTVLLRLVAFPSAFFYTPCHWLSLSTFLISQLIIFTLLHGLFFPALPRLPTHPWVLHFSLVTWFMFAAVFRRGFNLFHYFPLCFPCFSQASNFLPRFSNTVARRWRVGLCMCKGFHVPDSILEFLVTGGFDFLCRSWSFIFAIFVCVYACVSHFTCSLSHLKAVCMHARIYVLCECSYEGIFSIFLYTFLEGFVCIPRLFGYYTFIANSFSFAASSFHFNV